MIEKLKELHSVVRDLIIIDLIYLVVGELIIIVFIPDKLFYAGGFLAGVLFAIFAAVHMSITLNDSMYLSSNGAVKKSITSYVIRLVVTAVMLGVLFYSGIGDVFSAFLGMLALKVSAYLQPFTHKYFTK